MVEMTHTNRDKTHCVHGHEFTPKNTRIDSRGCRILCLACHAQIHGRKLTKPPKSEDLGGSVEEAQQERERSHSRGMTTP